MTNADAAIAEGDPSHGIGGFTVLWINEVTPGCVNDYIEKTRKTIAYYHQHGVRVLGCWVGALGAKSNQVLFLFDYGNIETYNRLYSDREFIAAHSSDNMQEMRSNTGWLLNPVDLTPGEATT